jgi:hypothetical protein
MNQFNNIGSMFPGAEHRLTREKAKHVLTMGVNFEITGLVMTDKITGDKCIVDSSAVRWMGKQEAHEMHAIAIAQAEYEYWKKAWDEDPGGYGLEGMAAAANIVGALTLKTPVHEFIAAKEAK